MEAILKKVLDFKIIIGKFFKNIKGTSWPWLYGSSMYNYLCSQCLSPLMFWVRILIRAKCTTLCDKVCQWLATGQWFSLGSLKLKTIKLVSVVSMLNTALKNKFVCLFVHFTPLSTIFQLYRGVQFSFIGGGNQRTQRKPLTCRKSLTNFIT
jgi:hypothetical protein